MAEQGFTFSFEIVNGNKTLNDQNVWRYEFINQGVTSVTINDQLVLPGKSGGLSRWAEDLNAGEKTRTQYTVKWDNDNNPANNLLVITKVPSK